jgi:predicted house-cleaning noncanonical NTP pyrophosphatase (MazG superfamily)
MSEYPIGLNGEMIHCLADDDYSRFCRNKLEQDVAEYELNKKEAEK